MEALRCLLTSGADVNARDDDNQTALYIAATRAGKKGTAEFVDLLLRSGADETIVRNDNKAAADVMETRFVQSRLAEDVERVRELLAKAPVDRAWRRRGYLVMCRAQPGRLQLGQETTSEDADVRRSAPRTNGGRDKQTRTMRTGCGIAIDIENSTAVDERACGDWSGVVAKVLGLQERRRYSGRSWGTYETNRCE